MNTITVEKTKDFTPCYLYFIDGVLYSQKGYETNGLAMKAAKAKVLSMVMKESRKVKRKTPQQRQFEQVVYKLRSQLAAMEETLLMMPRRGDNSATCQRINISNHLGGIDSCINGIELEDFTPNEYSGDFKFSYS